jgi:serine protease Do
MYNPLLKMAGLATLVLLLHTSASAQGSVSIMSSDDMDTTSPGRTRSYDEVIIRHKGDKDAKVTLEIKNGEIFVNGKPASEYKDDDLSISKRRYRSMGSGSYSLSDGDGEPMTITPFRSYGGSGAWNMQPKVRTYVGSGAFLGVTSIKNENGPEGAKIGEISEGSAAEKAGLKEGDIITKIDEKNIDGPESLSKVIHGYKPGDKVNVTYKRAGKEQKATAELGKSKAKTFAYGYGNGEDFNWNFNENDMKGLEELRRFKTPMPPTFKYSFGNGLRLGIHAQDTEDGKGVKVLDVDDETAASKAGIMEGDIITKFDGQEVNSATRLAELARDAQNDKAETSIKVNLLRAGQAMEVEVKVPRKLRTADL